jgi:hypothetical protein
MAPYAASKTAERSSFERIVTSSSRPTILTKIAARFKGDVTKCSFKLFFGASLQPTAIVQTDGSRERWYWLGEIGQSLAAHA